LNHYNAQCCRLKKSHNILATTQFPGNQSFKFLLLLVIISPLYPICWVGILVYVSTPSIWIMCKFFFSLLHYYLLQTCFSFYLLYYLFPL
jgi:hypothetical protein